MHSSLTSHGYSKSIKAVRRQRNLGLSTTPSHLKYFSYGSQCQKHFYVTFTSYENSHGDFYAETTTTIIPPPSRRHINRCKHNYHVNTVTTASMHMYAHISYEHRRDGLCRYKHKNHTTTVMTASMKMSAKLSCDHNHDRLYADVGTIIIRSQTQSHYADVNRAIIRRLSRRPLFRSKCNYHTTTAKTSSMQM